MCDYMSQKADEQIDAGLHYQAELEEQNFNSLQLLKAEILKVHDKFKPSIKNGFDYEQLLDGCLIELSKLSAVQ